MASGLVLLAQCGVTIDTTFLATIRNHYNPRYSPRYIGIYYSQILTIIANRIKQQVSNNDSCLLGLSLFLFDSLGIL